MINRIKRTALVVFLGILTTACSTWIEPKSVTAELLLGDAIDTVNRFRAHPELGKFSDELDNAHAVVILPTVIKLGLGAGGEVGNGVLLKHNADGSWGYPAYFTLAAASFGLQVGVQDTAIVLIVRNAGKSVV